MMRLRNFKDIIDLPAPFDKGPDALVGYAEIFAGPITAAYNRFKIFLDGEGSTEEDAFQRVIDYGRTRHLGGYE